MPTACSRKPVAHVAARDEQVAAGLGTTEGDLLATSLQLASLCDSNNSIEEECSFGK